MTTHTPTPVPSEVAETTAGDREACAHHVNGCAVCYPEPVGSWTRPAEPDAGEVEALLRKHGGYKPGGVGQGWRCWCDADLRPFWPVGGVTPRDTALNYALRAHVAVEVAALLDRARREEGAKVLREAATTILNTVDPLGPGHIVRMECVDLLRARAASVGRGEGL